MLQWPLFPLIWTGARAAVTSLEESVNVCESILTTLLVPGLLDTARAALPENARPRIRFSDDPAKTSKYTEVCTSAFEVESGIAPWPARIENDSVFSETYHRMTAIIVPGCANVFEVAAKVRAEKAPVRFSKKVEDIARAGKHLTRMIGAAKQGRLGEMMLSGQHPWSWPLYEEAQELPGDNLISQMFELRRLKGKQSYAARKAEINTRVEERRTKDLQSILSGRSATQVLGQEEPICMQPRVLVDPDDPTRILTAAHDVQDATRRAFQARFIHDPVPRAQEDKHWLKSAKSKEFRAKSKADPLIWRDDLCSELRDICTSLLPVDSELQSQTARAGCWLLSGR